MYKTAPKYRPDADGLRAIAILGVLDSIHFPSGFQGDLLGWIFSL